MDSYVCDLCGYVYDPAVGDPDNGGSTRDRLSKTFRTRGVCPVCGASKDDFSKQ